MRYRFLSFEKSYGDRQFIVRFKQYKKKKKNHMYNNGSR